MYVCRSRNRIANKRANASFSPTSVTNAAEVVNLAAQSRSIRHKCYQYSTEPEIGNVAAQQLAILLRIPDHPNKNIGPKAQYSNQHFLWFASVPPGKCRNSIYIYSKIASLHTLTNWDAWVTDGEDTQPTALFGGSFETFSIPKLHKKKW